MLDEMNIISSDYFIKTLNFVYCSKNIHAGEMFAMTNSLNKIQQMSPSNWRLPFRLIVSQVLFFIAHMWKNGCYACRKKSLALYALTQSIEIIIGAQFFYNLLNLNLFSAEICLYFTHFFTFLSAKMDEYPISVEWRNSKSSLI